MTKPTSGTREPVDEPMTPDGPGPHGWRASHGWPGRFARRHALFGALLATGVTLRVLTGWAYRPAFEFVGDSYAYIRLSTLAGPDPMRPAGYPAFLRLVSEAGGGLWLVPVVQHVLGVALAVAGYALLTHRRVATPIAAVAVAPLLLDPYQIVLEHFVMAETLFAALLVTAIVALMWSPRPSVGAVALAGLLLGTSGLVRTIGVAIALLAVGYVLLRRVGWLRLGIFVVTLATPLVAYASWFDSTHGKFAMTGGDAAWLYGRVAPIADCGRLDLAPQQLSLCSPHPVSERPDPSYYVWDESSPGNTLAMSVEERDALLADFSRQVITRQTGDYLRMVGSELIHYFEPGRRIGRRDWPDATWRYPVGNEPKYLHNNEPLLGFDGERPERVIIEPLAGHLRTYQRHVFAPGPALAVAAGLGLLGCLLVGRRGVPPGIRSSSSRARWRDLTTQRRRIAADCLFLLAAGAAILVVPAATVTFDYRYLLPVLFLFPSAGVLATQSAHLFMLARQERRESDLDAGWPPTAPPIADTRQDQPDGRSSAVPRSEKTARE